MSMTMQEEDRIITTTEKVWGAMGFEPTFEDFEGEDEFVFSLNRSPSVEAVDSAETKFKRFRMSLYWVDAQTFRLRVMS